MKYSFFQLPLFQDKRGKLVPLEFREQIPFVPVRLYYLFDNKETRGGHSHEDEEELFICLRGTFTAKIHDGSHWHNFTMRPGDALYNDAFVWHEFHDFSEDSLMLALSSTPYDPQRKGYIMDFDQFIKISQES